MQKTDALIMAAGSGERLGAPGPKQFATVGDRAMLLWALEPFAGHSGIDRITVVAAESHQTETDELLQSFTGKIHRVVTGGVTRQESVWNGLRSLESDSDRVLVHDAARPCLSVDLVDRLLAALADAAAVVPVMPAVDTLVLDAGGRIDALLDRVNIAGAQTPQAFRTEVLMQAHRRANAQGLQASDEGSLVFAASETVRTIPGESTNIKVTYETDLRLAEAILTRSRRS